MKQKLMNWAKESNQPTEFPRTAQEKGFFHGPPPTASATTVDPADVAALREKAERADMLQESLQEATAALDVALARVAQDQTVLEEQSRLIREYETVFVTVFQLFRNDKLEGLKHDMAALSQVKLTLDSSDAAMMSHSQAWSFSTEDPSFNTGLGGQKPSEPVDRAPGPTTEEMNILKEQWSRTSPVAKKARDEEEQSVKDEISDLKVISVSLLL